MSYKVEIAPIVSKKIIKILEEAEKYSASYKAKLTAKFKKAILSLNEFPYRYPLVPEKPWHSRNIHKMPIKPYIAYHSIREKEKFVSVEALSHYKQNQTEILEEAFGI